MFCRLNGEGDGMAVVGHCLHLGRNVVVFKHLKIRAHEFEMTSYEFEITSHELEMTSHVFKTFLM